MTDFSASTSEFTGSDLLDSTSAFDVEAFDRTFKTISAVESRWRLPALPDEVKLDIASMPGVTAESVTSLLSGLDRDINGEDEPSEPDPAINYKTSMLDPNWGRSGFDQFRVIAAGIAQRPAPTDPTVDAVKLFKQKAIKGGYLEVPDGSELDNIWSPELNSVRFKMAQDDYDKQMRGNRFGAVPVTGENGLIKQLDKWTSPGGLLAAATELDLFWDGGAISKEFSTWGDKWRKVGKSKNPWDFATSLVDAVTGPIDDVVFPVVNWALIGTGVGGIANAGKVGWLASRAGNGSKVWDTLYGASKILNPLEKSNISELGRASWTATKLMGSERKTLQGLGRGMEAWRGFAPVKATKSALQVPMRMGFISQAEDLFPGYGGQGASIGSIPGVTDFAEMARSTAHNPAFLPAEVLLSPYNIFTPGTFLRSAGEGANVLSRVGDVARRAGTAPGRAAVGAGVGAVAGAAAGDDAGDIAEAAGLGALTGLVLPHVGRGLITPAGRVIGSSALGALAGTGLAAVSDDDLSNGLMLGAVSGLGLVGANSVWAKMPNPGRWVGHIGTAMSMTNLKPLTDDQRVTGAFDRGLRAALNVDELAAYDREVKNTGSVLKGVAKISGTDDEGARHVLSWYLVNGAIDNTARVQAGAEGKGFYERFYMHRHKLTSQLRTFNVDDLSSQTLDDIARAMVVDQATTYNQFKTLWRRKRTEIAKDPQKALVFAKSHNENAALTLKQLLSTENLGLEDAADLPFDPAMQPTNLVPDWNKLEPEKKLGAFEAYVAGTRNTPFGQWDEFYASTEGLQRAMVGGWLDDARFKSARNFWGQEMGPGVELGQDTKQIQEHTAAVKEALFRMPTQDAAKAMKGNRFSPLASMATAGRFTVGVKGNPWKQDVLSLADEVGHYLKTKGLLKSLGSAEDITTPLGMIARAAEAEGLGTLDDLTDSSWKHLIKLTGTKSKRHKIDQLRKFANHKGMSMRDVETRLESAMDQLAHDDRVVAALGAGNDYVRGEDGAALRGSQALMQRRKQLNEKARYTAAEVDTDALRGQNPELDEMLDGLESRGYTLVHGVEFLSPHDLANSNALGFADMGTRELNYQTFGNFFRGKLPAIRRMEEERRYRTAIAHELSMLDDAEMGDITVDSKRVSDALEDLTKHVLQPLEDDHLRRVEDLHTLGFGERMVKRGEVVIGQFTVPRRPEDLMQSPERVLHTLTARGWTQAQAEAIAKAIPKMRNTTFADLGLYSFEAKFRQRNELVQALKFLGGSKHSHALQIAGGTVGAAAGAAQDPDAGLLERLGQGAIGAAVGAGVGTAARGGMRQSLGRSKTLATWEDRAALKSAGYLGDKLVRLRDNLRFGLSPFFDISRYTEGMMLAQTAAPLRNAKGERIVMPLNASPRGLRNRIAKDIKAENPGISSYQLKKESHAKFSLLQREFADAAHGDYDPDILESTRKWFSEVGIMGFNPADWMATAYKNLRLAGVEDPETAYKAAREMYTYGTRGRSAAELSVNFIFFPFSFQKKALGHIGKWMNDDLARSLIIHDAFKTYEILDEKHNLDDYWREHMPVLEQLNKLNLLAFGLSPGRFGGINAEVFGAAYRTSMAMFMPWAGSVKSPGEAAELQRVVRQLLPAMNDVNWMMKGVKENGFKGYFTPFEQTRAAEISAGYEEWNAYRAEVEGYLREADMTWSDLHRNPAAWKLKQQYEEKKVELADKYPEWSVSRREHLGNVIAEETERNDRIARVAIDPTVLPVLELRDTAQLAPFLGGLPQRTVDDLSLAWFDNQVAWVKDQLSAQGVSVGDADGWLDAPPEAVDYLRTRSQELRQLNEHWHGLYVKFFSSEFGPDEAPV